MDIVQFFLSYVFLFGLMLVTVLLTHISPAFGRFVNATKIATLKVITAATPDLLCKVVNKSFYYVFYTRNPLLQVLNVFLMLLGNMVYLLEVIPVLYTFKKEKHQILLTPFILLALTLVPFYLSCVSDPGKIVSTSKAACLALVYKPDGVMFSEGNYCRTCKQVKPARSKHCNLCGHCVHRFDHHCLWTNNCVGGGNLRYFLLFLVCLQIMVGHGALRGLEALGLVVRHSGLLGTRLFGDVTNGKRTVDDLYFLLENLFLHQPGCVLLVTSLILLFVLIGLLLSYHVMLVLYNQTTNERYKISSLSQQQQQPPCCETFDERKQHDQIQKYPNLTNTQLKTRMIKTTSDKISHWCCSDQTHQRKGERLYYNNNVNDNNNKNNNDNNACFTREGQNLNFDYLNTFYNRGALKNIKEVFFPWAEYDHIIKSKAKETERWNHRSFRKS